MRTIWLAIWGCLTGTIAIAECPRGQETFASCLIEGRNTEVNVCFDKDYTTYSYGPIGGAPELVLYELTNRVDFEPWPGVGKSIYESVTFYNGDYAYNVGGGFERPFSDEEMNQPIRRFGWVTVTESGETAANLECIPDTVGYGFGGGIYDVKTSARQTWDEASLTWVSDAIALSVPPLLIESHLYEVAQDCLPASEFSLLGVQMGGSFYEVGQDESLELVVDPMGTGELINRMSFGGLQIDLFQGKVHGLSTTRHGLNTPSGIEVGLSRGEVIRILGRVPSGYAATADQFVVPVCMDVPDSEDEWAFLIEFGQNKRVARLSFVSPSY